MISFTILTSDVPALRALLIANGILSTDGKGNVTPKPGVEFVIVPNPVVVTPAVLDKDGNVIEPAVMDDRKVFLVKVAHEALNFETKDDAQVDLDGKLLSVLDRTKLGKWAKANSVTDKIDGLDGRLIDGKHWLVPEDDGRFGVWQ
jgi:hypothetical protein